MFSSRSIEGIRVLARCAVGGGCQSRSTPECISLLQLIPGNVNTLQSSTSVPSELNIANGSIQCKHSLSSSLMTSRVARRAMSLAGPIRSSSSSSFSSSLLQSNQAKLLPVLFSGSGGGQQPPSNDGYALVAAGLTASVAAGSQEDDDISEKEFLPNTPAPAQRFDIARRARLNSFDSDSMDDESLLVSPLSPTTKLEEVTAKNIALTSQYREVSQQLQEAKKKLCEQEQKVETSSRSSRSSRIKRLVAKDAEKTRRAFERTDNHMNRMTDAVGRLMTKTAQEGTKTRQLVIIESKLTRETATKEAEKSRGQLVGVEQRIKKNNTDHMNQLLQTMSAQKSPVELSDHSVDQIAKRLVFLSAQKPSRAANGPEINRRGTTSSPKARSSSRRSKLAQPTRTPAKRWQ